MVLRNTVLVLAIVATLGGCGRSAEPATNGGAPARQSAYVRVVNGSPDIETVNPNLPPAAATCNFQTTQPSFADDISVQFNGVQVVASFPYGAVSAYVPVAPGPLTISVVYPNGSQNGCPSFTLKTAPLTAGSSQTIVVAGSYQQKTLSFLAFSDNVGPGTYLYGAAPSSSTVAAGIFTPGQSNYHSTGTVALGAIAPLPSAAQAPGLGYYVGAASSPQATLLPSDVDSFDANNVVPYNGFRRLSLFVIDPPLGSTQPRLTGGFN